MCSSDLAKFDSRPASNHSPSDQTVQLRLAAQKLADQLSALEELEARLEGMVENVEVEAIGAPRSIVPRAQPLDGMG